MKFLLNWQEKVTRVIDKNFKSPVIMMIPFVWNRMPRVLPRSLFLWCHPQAIFCPSAKFRQSWPRPEWEACRGRAKWVRWRSCSRHLVRLLVSRPPAHARGCSPPVAPCSSDRAWSWISWRRSTRFQSIPWFETIKVNGHSFLDHSKLSKWQQRIIYWSQWITGE